MAEYIDREAFLKDAETRYCLPCQGAGKDYNGLKCRACWVDDMMGDVDDAPTADVVPVVHGKWVEYPRAHYFKCSNCKYTVPYRKANLLNGNREYNYCPHCGAKMQEVE